jgi:hypothetical protein
MHQIKTWNRCAKSTATFPMVILHAEDKTTVPTADSGGGFGAAIAVTPFVSGHEFSGWRMLLLEAHN